MAHLITHPIDPDAPRAIGNGTIRVTRKYWESLGPAKYNGGIDIAILQSGNSELCWVIDTPAIRRVLHMGVR